MDLMHENPTLALALPDGASTVGKVLNHRCSLHDEGGILVVWVDGQVGFRFDADDVAATRLAMANISMREIATGAEIAAAFGVGTATVERACSAYRRGGVDALVPKRRKGRVPRLQGSRTDTSILALKRSGESVRAIAARFGVSRTAVETSLARSGWKPEATQLTLDIPAPCATAEAGIPSEQAACCADESEEPASRRVDNQPAAPSEQALPIEFTADTDPSDRSIDRLLARQGMLNDAAPLFEDADGVSDAGAMLGIAVLVQQGVFAEAVRVFHGIGPAFYGLRTAIACLSLLMILNLGQLQNVMQREPGMLGRLLGLDRSPELKTVRRKLQALAAQNKALAFMDALARLQLAPQQEIWVYVDGHVSVYTGKNQMREHHVARLRAARPSVIDYWVNQADGSPLLVITGPEQEGLVRQLRAIRTQLAELAPGKTITLIFDREGWSPIQFAQLAADPLVKFLTYRKAGKGKKLPRVLGSKFRAVEHMVDGQVIRYELADERVRIPYKDGKHDRVLELRQITRRKPCGKQIHILTNDFESAAGELAYRMIHRWTQENFFKYDRQHRSIDALVTHSTEAAPDGERLVPNPRRAQLEASIAKVESKLQDALRDLGQCRVSGSDEPESFRAYIQALRNEIDALRARRDAMPSRVQFAATDKGRDAVQPRVEARRLMHTFRMIADRADIALLELLRPAFKDWRHEGRSLVRAILHSSGSLRVTESGLHIQLAPQSSPYKTRALEALCTTITSMNSVFPGTALRLSFSVLPGRAPS